MATTVSGRSKDSQAQALISKIKDASTWSMCYNIHRYVLLPVLELVILLDIHSFRTQFSTSCYLVSKSRLLWSSTATSRIDILVFTPPEHLRLAHLYFMFKLQGNVSHLRFKGYYKGLHEFSVPAEGTSVRKPQKNEWVRPLWVVS